MAPRNSSITFAGLDIFWGCLNSEERGTTLRYLFTPSSQSSGRFPACVQLKRQLQGTPHPIVSSVTSRFRRWDFRSPTGRSPRIPFRRVSERVGGIAIRLRFGNAVSIIYFTGEKPP